MLDQQHHHPSEIEARLYRKVGIRIIPIIGLAYIMSYVDRVNLGYVAQPLGEDLGMTTAQIGLASSLFFIGYILVEVPSNMALRRFGARRWITRILVSWGLVTALTGFVETTWQLYLARIALGFAEAGLAAGILLYLTFWFPRRHRGWATSAFMLTIPLASIIGAPVAAALLSWGEALLGIEGWRSLFLVEGLLTIAIGFAVLTRLPDGPAQATWLTPGERHTIQSTLDAEAEQRLAGGALHGLGQALRSARVWALALAFFSVVFGLYPLAFFLPTMIANLGEYVGADAAANSALLSAIPSAVAIIAMIVWARVTLNRSAVFATTVPMAAGVLGLILATTTQDGLLFILAVCLSVAGIFSAMPQFWRIPAQTLTGAAAAGGIALINSVSNLSGAVGPTVTGSIETATGSFTYALYTIAAVMLVGIGILLTVGRRADAVGEVKELVETAA